MTTQGIGCRLLGHIACDIRKKKKRLPASPLAACYCESFSVAKKTNQLYQYITDNAFINHCYHPQKSELSLSDIIIFLMDYFHLIASSSPYARYNILPFGHHYMIHFLIDENFKWPIFLYMYFFPFQVMDNFILFPNIAI